MQVVVLLLVVLLLLATHATAQGRSCVTPEAKTGSCLPVASCPSVKRLALEARRTRNSTLTDLLWSYTRSCPSDFNKIEVCCPLPTVEPRPPSNFGIPPEIWNTMQNCGVPDLVDKIINGRNANPFAWPWTVLLYGQDGNGHQLWHCGGSLISTRYVLTAAHCFRDPKIPGLKVLKVRVGEHNLDIDPDCSSDGSCLSAVDLDLEEELLHPNFSVGCNACNDLALIRLSQDVGYLAPKVAPVCLPLDPQTDLGYDIPSLQNSRKRAVISGWGSVTGDPFRAQLPSIMQEAYVPLVQTPFCDKVLQGAPEPKAIICAGGEGPDTCSGDSGGPLVLKDKGIKWYLLGVTSKGLKVCGAPNTQGLYVNVHHYLSWILQNMKA